jgi:transcription elongation factor Elf1
MSKELPESYTCTRCQAVHELPMYVYAKWEELLFHTCNCGARHSLLRGVAKPVTDVDSSKQG